MATQAKAPMHLWIVGGLSLIWNAFGCYDYLMIKTRNAEWIASMMPAADTDAVFAWVDAAPLWSDFGWGLGVWLGLAGAALLLMRNRFAVGAYLLSLVGAVIGLGYQMSDPMPGVTGAMAIGMPIFIILVALGQFLYARKQAANGMLR